jgi:putative AlgH/UPF0301 family transcriptional regulator
LPPYWKQVTVGTTALQGLDYNKKRTVLAIYNLSSNIVYWDHSHAVLVTTGGPIATNQAYVLEESDGDDVHEPIWLIAGQSGNRVALYEGSGITSAMRAFLQMR